MSTETVTFTRTSYVIRLSTRNGHKRVLRLQGWTCKGLPRMSRPEAVQFARLFKVTAVFKEEAAQ